jgi:hypothetical protein
MNARSGLAWRICLAVGAAGLLTGGPLHPGGTMAEMLAHPDWLLSHILQLVGFVAMAAGLWAFAAAVPLPARSRRWCRLAIGGTVLQAIEMAVHTAAMVDHHNLVAGASTPILTTHLAMAVTLYPLFALALIGFIVAAARDHVLGWWTGGLGIIGAIGQGLSAPLVVGLDIAAARVLFPMIVLVALWLLIVAVTYRPAPDRLATL